MISIDASGIIALVSIAGLFLFLIIFFLINRMLRLNSAWSGIIIDKNSSIIMPTLGGGQNSGIGIGIGSQTSSLKIKTSDGKTKRISVTQGISELFKVGDHIVKRKGEFNPTKS